MQRAVISRRAFTSAALLAGVNNAAPDMTVRFELEYEMY